MKLISLGLSNPETRGNPLENPSVSLNDPAVWEWFGDSHGSDAGAVVNFITAQQTSTVNACIRLLANSISAMTPKLYEITGAGRVEALSHPLHRILSLEPNEESTAATLWSTLVSSVALTGNGYIEIFRDDDNKILSLWSLNARQTKPIRLPDSTLAFRTSDGMPPGQYRVIKAANIIHVPWHTVDGVVGVSVIEQARQLIGGSLAMNAYANRFFANNATPSGILTMPAGMKAKPEDKPKMRADWEEQQTGGSQHRVNILDQGMTFTPLTISQNDAQYLESKNYLRQELCGLFQIHPAQIGDTSRVAGETYEAQQLTFLVDCLTPWLDRIGQELNRKLLPTSANGVPQYVIEHDVSARLKLDSKTQMESLMTARQAGLLTTDEGRKMANLNPLGGDVGALVLAPVNMCDVRGLVGSKPPLTAAPKKVEAKNEE